MREKGLDHYNKLADERSKMLYSYIDNSNYYTNVVDKRYRSRINVPFRVMSNADLEAKFLKGAEALGLVELKGHRSTGGCRASCYNAMPIEGIKALIAYMEKFKAENPTAKL